MRELEQLDAAVAKALGWTLEYTMDPAPTWTGEWPGRFKDPPKGTRIKSGWAKWHEKGKVVSLPRYGEIKECDWKPTTDWGQGGPIIEREGIEVWKWIGSDGTYWCAHVGGRKFGSPESIGDTPLIAAMTAFVRSKVKA